VEGCLACDVNSGRISVPGGVIAETPTWRADHCIGAFGIGAVVVKTREHREDLWRLNPAEAAELGPFLRRISDAIVYSLGAERVYLTMWVDKPPHHVHMVLYPRWPSDHKRALDLQLDREAAGPPAKDEAAVAAASLRAYLQRTRDPE
jgi:diadenosine tetraphosphate (Ap4A) HIT family hydrolase